MPPPSLFDSYQLGPLTLRNRTVMAPLTRSRASQDGLPNEMMEIYYAQRASAGLIISEGAVISPQGVSYPRVPGLYSNEQVQAWRCATDAVHGAGGKIFAQLWHVGRQSHSSVQPGGALPVAPSAVRIENYQYYRKPDKLDYEVPKELEVGEISEIVGQYVAAAENALAAGFDGIELHAANGYLIDQFLNSSSNQRDDEYGGSVANRARFLHDILSAIAEVLPLDRVGVRLSPSSTWMDVTDADQEGLYSEVIESLNRFGLAYLHLVEPEIAGSMTIERAADAVPTSRYARLFDGPVIVTGEQTLDSAERYLASGDVSLIGFGRAFLANPDLPERLRNGATLNEANRRTFYSSKATGYLTYPSLSDERRWRQLEETLEESPGQGDDIMRALESLSLSDLYASGDLYSYFRLQQLQDDRVRSQS